MNNVFRFTRRRFANAATLFAFGSTTTTSRKRLSAGWSGGIRRLRTTATAHSFIAVSSADLIARELSSRSVNISSCTPDRTRAPRPRNNHQESHKSKALLEPATRRIAVANRQPACSPASPSRLRGSGQNPRESNWQVTSTYRTRGSGIIRPGREKACAALVCIMVVSLPAAIRSSHNNHQLLLL